MQKAHNALIGLIVTLSFVGINGYGQFRQGSGFRRSYGYIRPSQKECLDVAIVGGGIGGTYAAWRLRERGWKIAIYENTDRIGGRMFSVILPSVPNVPADLGAMRYVPFVHKTLESLFPQLGLRSEVFRPDQLEKMYYLRGTRLTAKEFNSSKLPYNLSPNESRNRRQLKWRLSQQALNVSRPDQIADIEEATTPDAVPLYKQSYMNLFDKIWSGEAKNFLRDVGAFHSPYDTDNNAVYFALAFNPEATRPQLRSVVGGMNVIPQRLAQQFRTASNRHVIELNKRVHAIKKIWPGGRPVYELLIFDTVTQEGYTRDKWLRPRWICATQVILALPPEALKKIQWGPLQDLPVQMALKSVTDFSAMKIYLAYPNAWWDQLPVNYKAFVTDLPLRQGGEFGRFRNSSGHETAIMLASYADTKENNDFWKHLRKSSPTISSPIVPGAFSISTKVVEHVHHHLATMYNVSASAIPQPIDGVMHIWDDPQNGKAWQTLKSGYQPKAVENFIQRPSASDKVFVVTNGFSRRFSSWSEGSLRVADNVLRQFFNVT